MAPALKALLDFLRLIRIARDYIKRFPGRGASFLALLGRKLNAWWRFWLGKFGRPKPAVERTAVRGTEARSYSVSGGPAVVREYVIAASSVPASASHPSLHERTDSRQPETVPQSQPPPVPTNLSVGHPPYALSLASHGSQSNLSALSVRSRASDRLSIITTSRESLRATGGQPSRLPRATHRQFGRGPDPSRSRDRPTRPNTPTPAATRPHSPTTANAPRLEIITNLPSPILGDDIVGPVFEFQPSTSSTYTHEPLSPPPNNEARRRQSSTSVRVDVQNPSTESLPMSSVTNPQITEEPLAIDHSFPDPPAVDLHHELVPSSPTSSNLTTLEYAVPEGRFVQLINSDQIPRYTKDATISRVETAYDVDPLTTKFPYYPEQDDSDQDSLQQDCSPWIPATHPDGALYFYDEERRLFTDTDMHNSTMRDEIEDFYKYLQGFMPNDQLSIASNNYDLVLDIMVTEDDQISWSYYYACHDARCLFWLEKYDASYMISELFGVKSPAHVKHRLESLYWNHWSLFPVVFGDRCLPLDAYDELMGILMHGCVDAITSKSSTLPYDDDTMRRMIRLVQGAKEAKGGLAYYTAGITRLLSFFAHWRFLYFHGQRHARLVRDQTVYDTPKRERSLLITVLSPLLFLAPEVHLREMEKLWTDEVIIETVWKSFMTKLLGEWVDVILWSTVMLTANVGFLAIPGVVLSNLSGTDITSASQVKIFTSASQIASSLSVIASIGGIMIGLLLVRHNRTKQKEDPAGASTYLFQNAHRIFGLEPMAIIFSLPWALLMWSMVIFFIALLLLCFSISNLSTRIFVAIMSVLVGALIGWCIWLAWESTEEVDVWQDSLVVLRRTRATLFRRVKKIFNPFHIRRGRGDHFTMTNRLGDRV